MDSLTVTIHVVVVDTRSGEVREDHTATACAEYVRDLETIQGFSRRTPPPTLAAVIGRCLDVGKATLLKTLWANAHKHSTADMLDWLNHI